MSKCVRDTSPLNKLILLFYYYDFIGRCFGSELILQNEAGFDGVVLGFQVLRDDVVMLVIVFGDHVIWVLGGFGESSFGYLRWRDLGSFVSSSVRVAAYDLLALEV